MLADSDWHVMAGFWMSCLLCDHCNQCPLFKWQLHCFSSAPLTFTFTLHQSLALTQPHLSLTDFGDAIFSSSPTIWSIFSLIPVMKHDLSIGDGNWLYKDWLVHNCVVTCCHTFAIVQHRHYNLLPILPRSSLMQKTAASDLIHVMCSRCVLCSV